MDKKNILFLIAVNIYIRKVVEYVNQLNLIEREKNEEDNGTNSGGNVIL